MRSRLGTGWKLHLLIRTGAPRPRPRAAGGASARRTSSRFPFPVGTRAAGLAVAPLQFLCRLGIAAASRAPAPHQLHSGRPDGAAAPAGAPGLGVPGRGPATAPGTGLTTGRASPPRATLAC